MTGLHPLVITCAMYLAHDELGSMLASTIKQVMTLSSAQTLDEEPSVSHRPEAEPRSYAESRLRIPAVRGCTDMTDDMGSAHLSPETINILQF
jgi:hypothetical protein